MEILLDKPGKKIILLGNEAIVRGALEAGVQFVATYPGTPASEIGNVFHKIAKEIGVYFEFSTNEKVALEAGIGASFSGLRTLVAMKHFGLNVALDSLLPLLYTGVKGGMVILVADDPGCWSSAQSEEDSRTFAYLAHIPILEPSDSQECKNFTKLAFQISEKFEIPVIIRTTTRVAHQRMPVELGKCMKPSKVIGKFMKDPERFVTMPPRVLEMKKGLLDKIAKIKEFSEKSQINILFNHGNKKGGNSAIAELPRLNDCGIICSSISYLYTMEALKELNLNIPVLKLGFFYPLPEEKIKNFIKNLKKVLIVEELEPYLEKEVERLAKNVNSKLQIFGKDLIPEVGELRPEIVTLAIAQITNRKFKIQNSKFKIQIPKRFPQLCPGCPYWLVVQAIKKATDTKKVIFGGDIGCYMLFSNPIINLQDYLSCMGSSIGIAHGIKKSSCLAKFSGRKFGRASQKLITFIGDSTFFHAGIPALINCVFNKSNPLIIILDNRTTAMTGHQPHPGAALREDSFYQITKELPGSVKIEDMVSACGVKNLKIIDPANQKEFIETVKEFLEKDEVSVIIARRICALLARK